MTDLFESMDCTGMRGAHAKAVEERKHSMGRHDYIAVGGRRWCRGCNTYQVFRGRWRDAFPPQPWPGYEATQPQCPART